MGLITEKTDILYAELNERAEGAIDSYSVTDDFLHNTHSVPSESSEHSIKMFSL